MEMMEKSQAINETGDESDSINLTDSTSDLSDLSNSHYQGIMLLQKLQQLKVKIKSLLPLDFNISLLQENHFCKKDLISIFQKKE